MSYEADREMELNRALDVISKGVGYTITTLRGSLEFRNAVEQLLVGTPNEKPGNDRYDFEGLYGRLRNELDRRLSLSAPPLAAPEPPAPKP